MVKVFLHLGWLLAFLVAVSLARPLHPRVHPPHQYELILPAGDRSLHTGTTAPPAEQALADDGAVRSERSTNLSHITGTSRKIRMYIKNRYLQILPDGTVNGTSNDGSDYTILQRQTVKTGQLLVQSVATCLFLCMDSCGLLYGARNFSGDCIFSEKFEGPYMTYSSIKYSNERRTLYMGLNKWGLPRKVQIKSKAPLGKLSSYVSVQPRTVLDEHVRELAERILRVRESLKNESKLPTGDLATIILAQHPLRHHGYHHLCPQLHPSRLQHSNHEDEDGTDDGGRDKSRCRRRKKRKKKKRRCKEGELEGEVCQNIGVKRKKKCQEGEDEKDCQKRLEAAKRRRKSRNGDKKIRDNKNENIKKKNKKKQNGVKNKTKVISESDINSDITNLNRTEGKGENQREVNGHVAMTTQSLRHNSLIPTPHFLSSSTILIPTASPVSTTSTTTSATSSSISTTSTASLPSTVSSRTQTAFSSSSSTSSASSLIPVMSLSSSSSTRLDASSSSSSSTSTSIGTAK